MNNDIVALLFQGKWESFFLRFSEFPVFLQPNF